MLDGVVATAAFETFPQGARFTMQWAPAGRAPVRTLLLLPPFGEEMNKSRRTLAWSARSFARHGWAVLALDLGGTGDSAGDFGDATWAGWLEDVGCALDLMKRRFGTQPTLWGVRGGSLLAAAVDGEAHDVLLWQPVINGDAYLTQLLRLRVANDAFAGREGTTTKQLRAQLEAGETLEVAGYDLNPELVLPLGRTSLAAWQPGDRRIAWLETGSETDGQPSPAGRRVVDDWAARGTPADLRWVRGEPFWLTQDISENTTLAQASIELLDAVTA
jgi:exosortase A-associated hydrolase 2